MNLPETVTDARRRARLIALQPAPGEPTQLRSIPVVVLRRRWG